MTCQTILFRIKLIVISILTLTVCLSTRVSAQTDTPTELPDLPGRGSPDDRTGGGSQLHFLPPLPSRGTPGDRISGGSRRVVDIIQTDSL